MTRTLNSLVDLPAVSRRLAVKHRARRLSGVGLLFAAVALTACDKRDMPPQPKVEQTVGIDVASAPSGGPTAGERVDAAGANARAGIAQAKQAAREVGQDIAAAGRRAQSDVKAAGAEAGARMADAVITTTVTAEFARDRALSASRIDVDTQAGRVSLHGNAANAADRDRATQIARNVKGVLSVDNQLAVDGARM